MLLALCTIGCNRSGMNVSEEDTEAKSMLQGIWKNDEAGNLAIMVKGDSILFPDTSSLPLSFWIYRDSLYTQGAHVISYKIVKQSEHLFKFVNQVGEEVKLVKSTDKMSQKAFLQDRPYAMNIFRTVDTDTVSVESGVKYDCKIHIEPTSDRMLKSTLTDEGIEVDNMYLDNMARLTVLKEGVRIYTHDFRKSEFQSMVPRDFLKTSILRSVDYSHADSAGVYFDATIGIPDASTGYVVELKVSKNGKLSKKLK